MILQKIAYPVRKLIPRVFRIKIRSLVRATPMQSVLKELKRRDIQLTKLRALEVFGQDGESHTVDYASLISSSEIWEIDPKFEPILRRNFPSATIKIVDSYEEIKHTEARYDLIVVDNPMQIYGGYCEHFLLFPDILRVALDSAILILNVIPEVSDKARKKYPALFNQEHLEHRLRFYKTDHPEKVSFNAMVETYKGILTARGFGIRWHFVINRSITYYLVMAIERGNSRSIEQRS